MDVLAVVIIRMRAIIFLNMN